MTQEEKQLLLKDLSARLPYGVRVYLIYDENTSFEREMGIGTLHDIMFDNVVDAKPYLRPMSSMTEEEKEFIEQCMSVACDENYGDYWSPGMWYAMTDFTDYCNSRFLDHRSLIEKGLALKATENTYKL